MFSETWVAVMMIVFVFIGAIISVLGWMASDRQCEKQQKLIKTLAEENKDLVEENEKLKSKLSLIKLRIELEGIK